MIDELGWVLCVIGWLCLIISIVYIQNTQPRIITVIGECPEPCSACIDKLELMEDTLQGIDDTRAEISRINYCSQLENRRLEVCR